MAERSFEQNSAMQAIGPLEVEVVIGRAHLRIDFGDAMQHPALKLRHVGVRDFEARLVMRKVAQQIAQRVAELAVGVHRRTG